MKLHRLLLIVAFGLGVSVGVATVVSTYTGQSLRMNPNEAESYGLVKRTDLEWLSTTAADGFSAAVDHAFVGRIRRVVLTADSDVSAAYDVTLLDEDDVDLLNSRGFDLTTATTSLDFSESPIAVCGPLTLVVDNTVGTGHAIIYWD